MHPAFVYIVVQALDEESRRANSYLPDPDPSVEPASNPIAPPPSRGRRSRLAAVAGISAAVRGNAAPPRPPPRARGLTPRATRCSGACGAGRRGRPRSPCTGRGRPPGTGARAAPGAAGWDPGRRHGQAASTRAPDGLQGRGDGIRVGPQHEPVERTGLRGLAGAAVADGNRARAIRDHEWIGVSLRRPEGMVEGAERARPHPLELRDPRRLSRLDVEPGLGLDPARRTIEVQGHPEWRHPCPRVQRQRPWVVRRERRPARGAFVQRGEQRPAQALSEAAGFDEQVAQLGGDHRRRRRHRRRRQRHRWS